MRTRFIGGPEHGKIKEIDRDAPYIAIPQPPKERYYIHEFTYDIPPYHHMRVAHYERRKVAFGQFAQLNVMVIQGMSEAHYMRAVADIVEGVA